jgi:hypothetical protein
MEAYGKPALHFSSLFDTLRPSFLRKAGGESLAREGSAPSRGRVMNLYESDTRSKLIDPALHSRGWTEDHIKREETAGAIDVIASASGFFENRFFGRQGEQFP